MDVNRKCISFTQAGGSPRLRRRRKEWQDVAVPWWAGRADSPNSSLNSELK